MDKDCICKQCHKKFKLIHDDRNGLFCCHKCFIQFSKENSTNYKIKGFSLLPNKCFYCLENNKKRLLVHHIDTNFLNNDINNLQIICRTCHSKQHKGNNSRFKKFKENQILRGLRLVLDGLQLDLRNPNFKGTPERILRSYYEIFEGLNNQNEIKKILKTNFPTEYNGMVIEGPIRCYSMCPHHFLPIIYDVNIGYIPQKNGLGLSKLPRLVELLAHAPKLQEDFTKEIVDVLKKSIKPQGVIVVVNGQHLCMQMRGIKKTECSTKTSAFCGAFKENATTREEFFELMKLK